MKPEAMNKEQRKRIIDKHRDSLTRHGHHPNTLYWSSQEIQELRFSVLAEIGIGSGDSVLDVGCGFGDMFGWLRRQGIDVEFTGIDLSPDLIGAGKALYPETMLMAGELFDFDFEPDSFEWVVLSGALNEALFDEGEYARRVIARMFELCRRGVAFNLLNRNAKGMRMMFDLASFEAEAMLEFCRTLTPDCRLRDDYLENDFTIYMLKGAAA